MRVSYNDEIPVSSLAACVFHMPLLGYTWLQRCASLFLRCSRACEVTSSPLVQFEVFVTIVQAVVQFDVECCSDHFRHWLPMNAQLLHADQPGNLRRQTRRLHAGECAHERSSTSSMFSWVLISPEPHLSVVSDTV